jgi:hypothetical protein
MIDLILSHSIPATMAMVMIFRALAGSISERRDNVARIIVRARRERGRRR